MDRAGADVRLPSLAAVVAGLPNDHYHAFADPMVFVLVGLGAGARGEPPARRRDRRRSPALPAGPVGSSPRSWSVALIGWNVAHHPPAVTPDGGFPAAAAAATRIETAVAGRSVSLRSLPGFKSAEAYRYPLIRDGADRPRPESRRPTGTW